MLEPSDRHLLLEAFRPPAGCRLDLAVGTTYSLDLVTLLTAPLAFTQFDAELVNGELTGDDLALLESLRRYARRIILFCQAGAIAVPVKHQRLLAFLESTVHEVHLPHRIFHPKLWLLRYRSTVDDAWYYRLICASRNLTFDRSWDTVLQLDGIPSVPGGEIIANRPLRDFLRVLPRLTRPASAALVRRQVRALADELMHVEFELPPGFDRLAFRPLGLPGIEPWPFPTVVDRLLVVSPFLTASRLASFPDAKHQAVLVSRATSLEQVGAEPLRRFDQTYVLASGMNDWSALEAEPPRPGTAEEVIAEDPATPLTGLHAKLYVADLGERATVWTGSANATHAGFTGNVEFLVELAGRRADCGVGALLSQQQDQPSFLDLLELYQPANDEPLPSADEELQRLEDLRRAVAASGLRVDVHPLDADGFELRITGGETVDPELLAGIGLICWPITLRADRAAPAIGPAGTVDAVFAPLPLLSITSFVAFTVEAGTGQAISFVCNADLYGLPEDRDHQLLRSLLTDRGRVLRYLLLLFAEEPHGSDVTLTSILGDAIRRGRQAAWSGDPLEVPLLEVMVQTLARDPQRLDQAGRLIEDLRRTQESRALLPDGLESVWDAIWTVRQEVRR